MDIENDLVRQLAAMTIVEAVRDLRRGHECCETYCFRYHTCADDARSFLASEWAEEIMYALDMPVALLDRELEAHPGQVSLQLTLPVKMMAPA